jgi:hypothetical protein
VFERVVGFLFVVYCLLFIVAGLRLAGLEIPNLEIPNSKCCLSAGWGTILKNLK